MINKRLLNIILLVLPITILSTSCQIPMGGDNSSKQLSVKIITVQKVDLSDELELNGTVYPEPNQSVKAASVLSGLLVSVEPKVGDWIQKGQLLARLENSVQTAQVQQAEAILHTATAALVNAQKNLGRAKKLNEEKIAAGKDVDLATSQEQSTIAQVSQATANLEQARANLSFTEINSPIQGVIAERYLDIGDQAGPASPIFLIVNPKIVIIQANLPVSYNSSISLGQKVNIFPPNVNKALTGMVIAVGIKVDPISNTLPVQIKVYNPGNILKIGMVIRLKILLSLHKSVLAIPKECLLSSSDDLSNLFVNKVDKGISSPVPVKTGITSNDKVEITNGLKIGDQIISDIGYILPEKTKVTLK